VFLEPVIEVMFFICSLTKAYRVQNQELKEQGNQPKHCLALNFTQDFQTENSWVRLFQGTWHRLEENRGSLHR